MKISVPSYVVPGGYEHNLRWLLANTDQRRVELLFFMYDDETRAILRDELPAIGELSARIAYTAHLPDRIEAGHEELLEAIDGFCDSYVVHPPREAAELAAFVRLMDAWRGRYGAERFLLENTRLASFEAADRELADSPLGPPPICADLGHLVLEGRDPASWLVEYGSRTREIHIHGHAGGKDHGRLRGDEAWLRDVAPFLRGFDGVVEIELFSWDEADEARRILSRLADPAEEFAHA